MDSSSLSIDNEVRVISKREACGITTTILFDDVIFVVIVLCEMIRKTLESSIPAFWVENLFYKNIFVYENS